MKAGEKQFGLHGIRHLFASLLAANNRPLVEIQQMLRQIDARLIRNQDISGNQLVIKKGLLPIRQLPFFVHKNGGEGVLLTCDPEKSNKVLDSKFLRYISMHCHLIYSKGVQRGLIAFNPIVYAEV